MKIFKLALMLMLLSGLASAQTLTPTQQTRANEIASQLRCLVCQNESLAVSSAKLAVQLRGLIRQQVAQGRSNQQIKQFMVQRYGIFVLLKPPISPLTALLYASPLLAFLIGALGFWLAQQSSRRPPLPLTMAEQSRLNELLK